MTEQARKWFTPREGQTPIDPRTNEVVPAPGKWVPANDEFWLRRVADGDGTLADEAPIGSDS